jgi:hypothetical protein
MYDRIALMLSQAQRVVSVAGMVLCVAVLMVAGTDSAASTQQSGLVDVGLVVFDPGIPADQSTHSQRGIFPDIRKAEAKYMPVVLRQVLIESGDWGVVRVLPEVLDSSELLVTGIILQSDGLRLQLRINARDASGVEWLNRVYSGSTRSTDYPASVPGDPYLGLYQQIADDLAAVLRQKTRSS